MFVAFLASVLIWVIILGLIFLWIIDGRVKKEQALHASFSALLSWAICEMIKTLWPTVRPFAVNGLLPGTITMPLDGAFPSAHSAVAFSVAVTLFLHDKKLGSLFLVLAIAVGVGRVVAYVHYPVDIIGGAIIGILIPIITEKMHLFSITS